MPPSSSDPYKYPGTNVLKNIPGIRDEAALQQYEYEQTALRADQLRQHSLPVRFDLIHLQSLHKHLFQDVYVWAGDLRIVDISKGGAMFALSHYIESEGRKMSADLAAANNLRGLNKTQFVQRLSHYYRQSR